MIEGYMKFYPTGVLVNVGAVNPCVKSKTNHLHANTGVRKNNLRQPDIALADPGRYNMCYLTRTFSCLSMSADGL